MEKSLNLAKTDGEEVVRIVGNEKAILGVEFGVVVSTVRYESLGVFFHRRECHYLVEETPVRPGIFKEILTQFEIRYLNRQIDIFNKNYYIKL